MVKKSRVKILLAAGVFYPDVGGPAIHVQKIAERLANEGYKIRVVAYGDDPSKTKFNFSVTRVSRKFPKIIQWFLYLFLVFWHGITSKLIYAFDPTAAGVPAQKVAKILNKPFLIRVGGDPIWEREVELGGRFMPITLYYEKGLYLEDKPKLFKAIKNVLSGARVLVVDNQFFKNFYFKYYGVAESKIRIVKNPVFRRVLRQAQDKELGEILKDPKVLFAGRFVAYKNLTLVINAFNDIQKKLNKCKLILIGDGPDLESLKLKVQSLKLGDKVEFHDSMPQERLFEYIKESAICIGPALSEFNPNFILESLSFGKPVLLSEGNGLSVDLPKQFLFNPLDQSDLEFKILNLLNQDSYKKAVQIINNLSLNQTWENVTDVHLSMIKELTK